MLSAVALNVTAPKVYAFIFLQCLCYYYCYGRNSQSQLNKLARKSERSDYYSLLCHGVNNGRESAYNIGPMALYFVSYDATK